MPRYSVTLPIAGYAIVEVEALDEASAIEEALGEGLSFKDIEEWDCHRNLVRGNVCYAPVHSASAELIEEDE